MDGTATRNKGVHTHTGRRHNERRTLGSTPSASDSTRRVEALPMCCTRHTSRDTSPVTGWSPTQEEPLSQCPQRRSAPAARSSSTRALSCGTTRSMGQCRPPVHPCFARTECTPPRATSTASRREAHRRTTSDVGSSEHTAVSSDRYFLDEIGSPHYCVHRAHRGVLLLGKESFAWPPPTSAHRHK